MLLRGWFGVLRPFLGEGDTPGSSSVRAWRLTTRFRSPGTTGSFSGGADTLTGQFRMVISSACPRKSPPQLGLREPQGCAEHHRRWGKGSCRPPNCPRPHTAGQADIDGESLAGDSNPHVAQRS